MEGLIVKCVVVLLSLFVFAKSVILFYQSREQIRTIGAKLPLMFTGFIANVADTLGLGSFAVIIALNNRWKFVDDKLLPGTLNTQSVLPAMLQSILFLNFVDIDLTLLVTFTLAACAGGVLGGFLVTKLDKQSIRLAMISGFVVISLLIFAKQLDMFPVGGEATSLSSAKLMLGVPGMMLAGMLPAIGAGLYVPIQVILFLLGLSPLVAFPIMTTAGAIVQSLTAYVFVERKEVAIRESLVLAFAGLVGVAVAVPMVTWVNTTTLRWLLLGIVLYNTVTLRKAYLAEKAQPVVA